MSSILESVCTTFTERPRVAILMSGTGSNARNLLKNEAVRDLYDIRLVFTDNAQSNAVAIAEEYTLKHVVKPVQSFRDTEHRMDYFDEVAQELGHHGIDAVLYAGFMKVSSPPFCESLPGVNVHPADLTIKDPQSGVARYRGMYALSAMRKQEGFVASSMHVADCPVDTGSVLAVSSPFTPSPEISDQACHRQLQEHEHRLYPAGLIKLAQGIIRADTIPMRIETNA